MVLNEDHDCGVCYEHYCRNKHVPRMLFCSHTFCSPCLKTMATYRGDLLTVKCPLCRKVSCLSQGLTVEQGLWINSLLWDHIPEVHDLEVKEEDLNKGECREEQQKSAVAQASFPSHTQCRLRLSPQHDRIKLHLPGFLKRMIVHRQSQERIVPRCNVQVKSWGRLSGEEMP